MNQQENVPASRERKSDAIRRLQVGLTGLVLVALLVGLSTLLTSETRQAAAAAAADNSAAGMPGTADPAASEGALTDLGVEPAAADSGTVTSPNPNAQAPAPVGPLVPDLQPDPQLKGTPRR